jgi:methanogenic corrinoid protein MtbC1
MKVLLGGAPITDEFGRRIGADAATNEALSGIRTMEKWMKEKSQP